MSISPTWAEAVRPANQTRTQPVAKCVRQPSRSTVVVTPAVESLPRALGELSEFGVLSSRGTWLR
jgi:hypothetical protein